MYLKKINLKNKYALVTGAGKGLGRACAIALAEAGAIIIGLSRTKSDLDKLEKDIKNSFRKVELWADKIGYENINIYEINEDYIKMNEELYEYRQGNYIRNEDEIVDVCESDDESDDEEDEIITPIKM